MESNMEKPASDTAIRVKDLRKVFRTKTKKEGFNESLKSLVRPEYKEIEAVCGIDLEVPGGELLAFLGPNGAGKSTTIKMLTGILHATSGSMSVLGFDPEKQRKNLSFRIGSVFGRNRSFGFTCTVPAQVLSGRADTALLAGGALLAVALFAAATVFFRLSIRKYSSASS